MIEIRDLTLGYPKSPPVLNNLSLRIGPGETVYILGPNGCGKSTLLKAVLRLLPVPPGRIFLDDRPLEKIKRIDLARRLAYVPQEHQGFLPYSALDVALMGRTATGSRLRFSTEDRDRAEAALQRVGLARLAGRSYLKLSGGERRLVLIARALAQDCAGLIMDEPASGLDYGHQFRLLDVVGELTSAGPAVVMTTHHPEQALYLGGRAVLMAEGRLVADGPAEELITPARMRELYNLPGGRGPRGRRPPLEPLHAPFR